VRRAAEFQIGATACGQVRAVRTTDADVGAKFTIVPVRATLRR